MTELSLSRTNFVQNPHLLLIKLHSLCSITTDLLEVCRDQD